MKKNLIFLFSLVCSLTSWAQQIASPDGRLLFNFHHAASGMSYDLSYDGQPVTSGQLGVTIDNHLVENAMGIPNDHDATWTANMSLQAIDTLSIDTTWTPLYGENATVRDCYRQLTLHFSKGGGGKADNGYNKKREYLFDIIVRAYNEGLAVRYHFPEATNGLFMHVTGDLTSFRFAPGAIALHEAWAQGPYQWLPLSTTEEAWKDKAERPLLMRTANQQYVALLEAALSDFVRGKFRLKADNELQMSMESDANVITPYDMPWRVVMVGQKAVDLINNKDLLLSLNEPCQIENTDFIRPGRVFRCGSLDNKSLHEAIDFAAEMGLEYVELDAGWYGNEMEVASSALKVSEKRDFDMAEICQYAHQKGVGIWVYVNQRALWNQLDQLLPLYKQWGISGIKFGFVQVGDQMWTSWMHDAVRRCAEYQIMVDIHDEYRPTGWSRTYPNLLTQEGIRGNEEMPDATHNTLLPFSRYLCGPGDYTLCYYNGRVKNTKAHQLAMAAVYYSPLQFYFWYDKPSAYKGEAEIDFWRQCPTTWDESRALDGEPGAWIAQARRKGNDWFLGIMTSTDERTVTINTADFLQKGKKYVAEIYEDDPSLTTRTKIRKTAKKVKAGQRLTFKLQASGGAAVRFVAE